MKKKKKELTRKGKKRDNRNKETISIWMRQNFHTWDSLLDKHGRDRRDVCDIIATKAKHKCVIMNESVSFVRRQRTNLSTVRSCLPNSYNICTLTCRVKNR